jgi:hypothetical protein
MCDLGQPPCSIQCTLRHAVHNGAVRFVALVAVLGVFAVGFGRFFKDLAELVGVAVFSLAAVAWGVWWAVRRVRSLQQQVISGRVAAGQRQLIERPVWPQQPAISQGGQHLHFHVGSVDDADELARRFRSGS